MVANGSAKLIELIKGIKAPPSSRTKRYYQTQRASRYMYSSAAYSSAACLCMPPNRSRMARGLAYGALIHVLHPNGPVASNTVSWLAAYSYSTILVSRLYCLTLALA